MQNLLYSLATDRYRGFIPGIIKVFLFILSLLYGLVVSILILYYRLRPYRLKCKVISVGNITLGGTGKTSLVEYIARYLRQQGRKVAILSHGYKRTTVNSDSAAATYENMGDEPYMLSQNLGDIPVIVKEDRVRAAQKAIENYGVDTVILDDGFQQWRITKDLEIVTVDATNPFGNRCLLPRGILRQPIFSLKQANIFVLTKVNLNRKTQELRDFLIKVNPDALIAESMHTAVGFYEFNKPDELLGIELVKGEDVVLFSGIADPDSFENLIQGLGANISLSFRFRDHYAYTQEDLDKIIKNSQDKKINTIITTEKDIVRLSNLRIADASLRLLVLRIRLAITKNEEGFRHRLLGLYTL